MSAELSEEELKIIAGWYQASAGESAHESSETLFALIEKLGIAAHSMDLYALDPNHYREEYRPKLEAHRRAIAGYRKRHPELRQVQVAEKEQPL